MILTLGDSFTYGEELDDLNQAWPYALGRILSLKVNNLGIPSGSNDRMFRLAVGETARQQYDLVIVAWSDASRLEIRNGDHLECVNHCRTKPTWLVDYYKYGYDDQLAHERWFTSMLTLQAYFKSIQQSYLFCTIGEVLTYDRYYPEFKHILDQIDLTYCTSWPRGGFLSWQGDCPKGPGGHPLELGHERIANKLAEYIRELNLL